MFKGNTHARAKTRTHASCSGLSRQAVYVSQTLKPFANIEMLQKARECLLTLHENAVFAIRTLQN